MALSWWARGSTSAGIRDSTPIAAPLTPSRCSHVCVRSVHRPGHGCTVSMVTVNPAPPARRATVAPRAAPQRDSSAHSSSVRTRSVATVSPEQVRLAVGVALHDPTVGEHDLGGSQRV